MGVRAFRHVPAGAAAAQCHQVGEPAGRYRRHHGCAGRGAPAAARPAARGIGYKKAGVALLDLARPEELQADLFGPTVVGNERLMTTMDQINQKFSRGTAGLGASGWQARPAWGIRQHMLSPNYTTCAGQLPPVKC